MNERAVGGRKFFEPPLWIAVHWKNVDKSGLYF